MKERDWDKELAKIDAQLRSLPEDEPEAVAPAPAPARTPARPGSPVPGVLAPPPAPPGRFSSAGAFFRLGLAGALAIGMALWPFDARCGWGLAAYLASTGVLVFAGGWSAVWTWRHRTPRAHIIALAIVLWGLVLASVEILPRVGYGPATLDRPRIWTCG